MGAGRHSANYMGGVFLTWDMIAVNTEVRRFPVSWQGRLRRYLGKMKNAVDVERWRREIARLTAAEAGGLRPDASDGEIVAQADVTARDFDRRLRRVAGIARAKGASERAIVRLQAFFARHVLRRRGLLFLWRWTKDAQRAAAVARMACPLFWRRAFRRLLAATTEGVAVGIGLVRKSAGLYCSDDAVARSRAQDARNVAVLESVVGVNDALQAYTLAELAARGVANQEIRRHELLTRIAGFELIAKDCGHFAVMVTVTCPSRFHAATTRQDGRVVDNPRYERLSPRDGQEYLARQWSRCRAAAARAGLEWYGFRIAEPQHDGTPHWHVLLFMPRTAEGVDSWLLLKALVRRYFLDNENPNEPGAQKYRVDFEAIDWNRGSAVGYVIKYISKNIDGHGVGVDLFGNDAITSSQRVRAWARTWRIRQFQQIGGAPVGVWRELRRLDPENVPETAPAPIKQALSAINIEAVEPGVKALAWAKYTRLQGGTSVRRDDLAVKLVKVPANCGTPLTRYGEIRPDAVVGVCAWGVELFRNHIHDMNPAAPEFQRRALLEVESERAQWVMGGTCKRAAVAVARAVFERSRAAASTRIHVNNCTRPDGSVSPFSPVVRRVPKSRRYGWRETAPGRPPGTSMELLQ
ncbi:replication endonuclease [Diaphorobacter nitroreducens]|uniref:replication endonuclease n=1 Tax=Diaphorobacter nitroreducens TaxID=164759 RepID=UPI0028A150B1|nr:replication endonuclease [Diaphorobacter nitroreducens]